MTDTEKDTLRAELESKGCDVFDTTELQQVFTVKGFMAPFVVVTRKSDGVVGSLEFTHSPRLYFNFKAD